MVKTPVYLDNHATTRVDPRVLTVMLPYFTEQYGNAASRQHVFGQKAEEAVDLARVQVAELIGAEARTIVFTSGATESDNLAIKGVAAAYRKKGDHLISVATEHNAILDPLRRLERDGYSVTILPVDRYGRVSARQVEAALTDRTILVSVMAANNEIGTLQPIGEIGRLCKSRGVLFHTDAVQAAGKIPLDVDVMGIDLLSLSAHKMYGPKGVGALYVRRRDPHVRLEPLFDGGGHERGLRSGTLPVPNIVGFGKACELCAAEMGDEAKRLLALHERLRTGIQDQLEDTTLHGCPTERLPNNVNLGFAYIDGGALMTLMRSVAVSSGSACTSASDEPSHVLTAIGVSDELARGSIRYGLGRFTTPEEVNYAVEETVRAVQHLRAISPEYELRRSATIV
ncbi:MAG TPA: IscS subfamily cysteine desulfurase [Planctomycetales bacterium]|jgi:cysteine desulfurase|nr:IscS subfamily cysteine desulfurase [Planctomycetales bacterium]